MTTIKINQYNEQARQTSTKLVHAEQTIDRGSQQQLKELCIALLVEYKKANE